MSTHEVTHDATPAGAGTDGAGPPARAPRLATVTRVQDGLVSVRCDGPLIKNEVGHILLGEERLQAEVLRIRGDTADLQVFEDTTGVRAGDQVELSGELLSVTLGPGLLGQVYDGLQNPLHRLADQYGFFLPRGRSVAALDGTSDWTFQPTVALGAEVAAGWVLGTVAEGPFEHRIMVPFHEQGPLTVSWIRRGDDITVTAPVARLRRADGSERELTLQQRWPVRVPIPRALPHPDRRYPREPLTTTQRIIDTLYPIARGGTACIPGPFGAGKTVLQSLIARHTSVDIVIVIACGERAGEVVETITEYPDIEDPRTGGSLMDRTIIICNTSSMPVAAREASIFTGVTLGEYYRQMGYDVLCIADSTSRWAQAMRETSGRMEEIPGEEAYPAYLDSQIKGVYERAGVLGNADGSEGSLTLIGTVSPAGGNFEEPVTQATLSTVKTFLGLSSDRAYRRAYPAIDPLISWSRYVDQLADWLSEHMRPDWTASVEKAQELLRRGDGVYQMMQVTGEEGITLSDYVLWQKSVFFDAVFLQQDAFDPVDASTSRERQLQSFDLVEKLCGADYDFTDREDARSFFTRLTALYRNLNYSGATTPEHARLLDEIKRLARDKSHGHAV